MNRSLTAKELATTGLFTALTAILAQIAVPIPFTPMPISFGMVGIYMTGMLLRPKSAVLAQVCYLLLGAVGVPVFGNFRGGVGALFGPTGGYLMMYPVMAAIVSLSLNSRVSLQAEKKGSKASLYFKTSVALSCAICAEYLGGTLWLTATTVHSFYGALTVACFPFIPLDIVKIAFCVFAILPFRARLRSMNLLSLGDD